MAWMRQLRAQIPAKPHPGPWLAGSPDAWMCQESQHSSHSHSASTNEEKEKIKSWPSL